MTLGRGSLQLRPVVLSETKDGKLLGAAGRCAHRALGAGIDAFHPHAADSRSRRDKVKLEPYECGIAATSLAFDHRFSVRYFLIAVLFIVFDVETVFLFPWAIRFKQLGWFGLSRWQSSLRFS